MSQFPTRRRLCGGVLGLTAMSALPTVAQPDPDKVQILGLPVIDRTDAGRIVRFEVAVSEDIARHLSAIEIVDARTRMPILAAAGGKRVPLLSQGKGGQGTFIYIDAPLTNDREVGQIVCKLTWQKADGHQVVEAIPLDVDPRAAVSLGAPLRGGPWIAIHNHEWPRGHRRVVLEHERRLIIPGRFAIDFVKADAAGRTTRGDPDATADAFGYGDEVLAVADAQVVAVRNDLTEVSRISRNVLNSAADAAGNFVVLDLGTQRYAVYEHLKPNSIPVKVGDRVRVGDVVGRLGFTGDSTGPHLHFHVCDRPSPIGDGRPFVFRIYRRLGRYGDIAQLGSHPWTPEASRMCQQTRPSGFSAIYFT